MRKLPAPYFLILLLITTLVSGCIETGLGPNTGGSVLSSQDAMPSTSQADATTDTSLDDTSTQTGLEDIKPVDIEVTIAKLEHEIPDALLIRGEIETASPGAWEWLKNQFKAYAGDLIRDETASTNVLIEGLPGAVDSGADIVVIEDKSGEILDRITGQEDGSFVSRIDSDYINKTVHLAYYDADSGQTGPPVSIIVAENNSYRVMIYNKPGVVFESATIFGAKVLYNYALEDGKYAIFTQKLNGSIPNKFTETDEIITQMQHLRDELATSLNIPPYIIGVNSNLDVVKVTEDEGIRVLSDQINNEFSSRSGNPIGHDGIHIALQPDGKFILAQPTKRAGNPIPPLLLIPTEQEDGVDNDIVIMSGNRVHSVIERSMAWINGSKVISLSGYIAKKTNTDFDPDLTENTEQTNTEIATTEAESTSDSQGFKAEILNIGKLNSVSSDELAAFYAEHEKRVLTLKSRVLFKTDYPIRNPVVSRDILTKKKFFVFECVPQPKSFQICLNNYDDKIITLTTGKSRKTNPTINANGEFIAYNSIQDGKFARIMLFHIPTKTLMPANFNPEISTKRASRTEPAEQIADAESDSRIYMAVNPRFAPNKPNIMFYMCGYADASGFEKPALFPCVANLALSKAAGRFIPESEFYDPTLFEGIETTATPLDIKFNQTTPSTEPAQPESTEITN